MNTHTYRTTYNHSRGCLMAVAETAKSSGKASGESRPSSKQTRRKARFTWSLQSLGVAIALSLQAALVLPSSYAAPASLSQQGLQTSEHSTSINSALSRNSSERYAASQLGSGDEALRCALLHFATCTRPHLFAASETAAATQTATGAAFAKVTNSQFTKGTPAITVPNNSLFRTPSNINATYLVETDPKFANYKKWLSSDYLLTALSFDPVTQQKRLGDGFYEQRLIREQVATLTGQRFLAGYQSEEEEYRALMDNAVTVAKTFNLRPGIALSEEQVAQLTSDIVWLVEKDVLLPNGTTVKALVPQVYAKLRTGDLQADGKLLGGSLLSGNSVNLEASGNITNGGTILGRKLVSLTADNINNSNAILGGTVALTSKTDINNTGGNITAKDALLIDAGRDLNVVTNTNTTTAGARTATTLDRVAGLYVTSPTGILVANAGNNMTLTAAQIKSAGSAQLQTTNGTINLGAATTGESMRFGSTGEATFHQNLAQSQQTGTSISTGGNLTMAAGQGNVIGVASNISAGGAATITADGAVVLTEGRNTKDEDLMWVATDKDLLSKTTTTTSIQSSSNTATGNSLTGSKGVTIAAGGQVILNAINVTSTAGNISVTGSEVSITSGLNSASNSREEDKQKTGISVSDLITHRPAEGLNAKKNTSDAAGSTSLAQTTLTGQNIQVTATGTPSYNTTSNGTVSTVAAQTGNITLGAVAFTATGANNSTGTVNLNAGNGTVNFNTVQTTNFTSHAETKSDVFFQSAKGEGSQTQNTSYTTIQGNLSVAANRITIQGVSASLNAAVNDVSNQAGMEWIKQLATDPQFKDKIDWKKVDEIHKTWNYDQFGLSKAGAAVLTVVMAYVTAGAGSGLAGTTTATAAGGTATTLGTTTLATTTAAGVTSYTAVGAAINAGFTALATQFSVAMINNQGDLSKALDAMGQSANVKNLLTSMATAGALQGLMSTDFMKGLAPTGTGFAADLQRQLISSTASAVVNAAVTGTSLEDGLKSAVSNAILSAIAKKGANTIGDAYVEEDINKFTQLFAHAALGCVVGAAKTSTASGGGGCNAGALGGVIGELTAEWTDDGKGNGPGGGRVQDFAGMMAAIAVALNGGNPAQIGIAQAAAVNAAENNWLATAQKRQMRNELAAANNALDKMKIMAKWAGTSLKQDALTTVGVGKGLVEAGISDIKGMAEFLSDPVKGIEGLSKLITDPAAREQMGEALYQSLSTKINNMKTALEVGGDANAVLLGQELGSLIWQVGSVVTGVGGAATATVALTKAGISLSSKAIDTMQLAYQLLKAEGKGLGEIVALADTKMIWSNGAGVAANAAQGNAWERFVQSALPSGTLDLNTVKKNFQAFDHLTPDGVAVSSKSLDTATTTYQTPSKITNKLNSYVDDMVKFVSDGNPPIEATSFAGKQMQLAIPAGTSADQLAAVAQSVLYAQSKGVQIVVTKVR